MEPREMIRIRESLGLTQNQLADALGCSYAMVSRWESENPKVQRPIPTAVERQLRCLADLATKAKAGTINITREEIKEALAATGASGVLAAAARQGLISGALVAGLGVTAGFGWLAALAGVGVVRAMPFFKKLEHDDSLQGKGGAKD